MNFDESNLNSKYRHSESLVFLLVWITIYLIPVLLNVNNATEPTKEIMRDWIIISAFLGIFIINIYFLIPSFLAKKQYIRYALWVLMTTTLIVCVNMHIVRSHQLKYVTDMPPMVISSGRVPMEFSESMPPPPGFQEEIVSVEKENNLAFLQLLAVGILVAGTGATYRLILYWVLEEKKRKKLEASLDKSLKDEYLLIKADYKTVKVKISDILYIESANEYIKIYMQSGEAFTTLMRLKNIETRLPSDKFMRVQRSFIVNLEKIIAVEKNKLYIEHKKHIPIGEQYKEAFQDFLGKNFVK